MRNDPQHNLKWLEQELLDLERPAAPSGISDDTAELLAQVDNLLTDLEDPEPPAFARKRKKQTKGERVERQSISRQAPSAAVYTKTRRQLRKQRRKQKKDNVNRNIKDLVVLAVLEIIGILCILGWWLQ